MHSDLTILDFDPSSSDVVREPDGLGYGNWVGGKVSYDAARDIFVLFYRVRKPLEHGRAGLCGVAVSPDGYHFDDVWTATKEDFNEITDEIENASMGELETSLRAAMAGQGIPQEYANPQVAQQGRLLDHLKQHAPPRHAPDWVDGRAEKPIPQSERNTFMRRVRAGLAPVSVLGDFVNGQLTREAADTWWQTQPLAASQVADELKRLVDLAIAHGKKFTPKEKRMIGFMIDPSGQLLGPSGNVSLVQMLQMNYANEDAGTPPPQVGGPKPPGDPGAFKGINQNTMDTVQQLTSRAQKRA